MLHHFVKDYPIGLPNDLACFLTTSLHDHGIAVFSRSKINRADPAAARPSAVNSLSAATRGPILRGPHRIQQE